MKSAAWLGLALAGLVMIPMTGCGSDDDDSQSPGSTGGTPATGGTSNATGATPGTTGGTDNATGGTSTAAGGTDSASGGASAAGGASGNALYGFATGLESFTLQTYTPSDPTYTNLASTSTLAPAPGTGYGGAMGSAQLNVPFSGYSQFVDIQVNITPAQNYAGKTLRARVMIESGFTPDAAAPGGGYIFVKTGTAWTFAQGAWTNLPPTAVGTWVEFVMVLDSPSYQVAGYDPTQVVAIGIQIATGGGTGATSQPSAAVVYVDEITIS